VYITIPVFISRTFDEAGAREAGVACGRERTSEEIELELEKLLAPYDFSTGLRIRRRRLTPTVYLNVPNYGARFDFWEPDDRFFEVFGNEPEEVQVEHRIYPREEHPGYEVVAASSLPLDLFYDALPELVVAPVGRHPSRRRDEGEALARMEQLIRDHSECLAVVCNAHV
jgi:hypothetical protein